MDSGDGETKTHERIGVGGGGTTRPGLGMWEGPGGEERILAVRHRHSFDLWVKLIVTCNEPFWRCADDHHSARTLAMEREHQDLIREVFGHSDGDTNDGVESDDVPSGTGREGVQVVVAAPRPQHSAVHQRP